MLAQLRDVLAAKNSAVMTKKNKNSGAALPKRAELHVTSANVRQDDRRQFFGKGGFHAPRQRLYGGGLYDASMRNVSSCPDCGGGISHCRKALVAPFLARRIWGRAPFPIDLMKCTACGLSFFNPRLELDEEGRLYAGYREAEYQQIRQSVEPWYTPRFNANITNPEFLERRKAKVAELLRTHLSERRAPKILDFGGAHGELVADLIPGAEPYVYDVSGVDPLAGVRKCEDLNACRNQQFDLILSSNVLEHLGSPRGVMDQMREVAGPETMLWVEVPHESPAGLPLTVRRLVQHAVLYLLRPRLALSLTRPGALCLMHEHVNFFNVRAMERLLACTGWNVKASGTYELKGPLGRQEWVWALGKAT